jgi:hypothetical protein
MGLPGAAGPSAGAGATPQRGPHLRRRCPGSGRASLCLHPRTPPRGASGPCPRPAAMGTPSPFPRTGENLSRAEGILRVRLSETRDSDARASRLTPNVASARCSLLTRLFSALRQRMGIASTARARFVTATAGITANGFIC